MKFEGICSYDECITEGHVQLLEAERLSMFTVPQDEDGEPIPCPWCNAPMIALRVAPPDAMFAVGEVRATEKAKRVLSAGSDDPLEWTTKAAPLIQRHRRGDHGAVGSDFLVANLEARSETPTSLGRIVSMYIVDFSAVCFITSADRKSTLIVLPEEAVAEIY